MEFNLIQEAIMKEKEFAIVALSGRTFDDEGNEFENCQILDFITAQNSDEALNKFQKFGSYKDIKAFEIVR